MSEQDFLPAIALVLVWEGGYVNDPQDPGGETNFGISAASYPDVDIANLTRDDAINIYRRDYWVPLHLAQLAPTVAGKVLDMAINMGQHRAVVILQRAVNNIAGRIVLTTDGAIGPLTIAAANATDERTLLAQLRVGSASYYNSIAENHPAMRKYLRGWLRRAQA